MAKQFGKMLRSLIRKGMDKRWVAAESSPSSHGGCLHRRWPQVPLPVVPHMHASKPTPHTSAGARPATTPLLTFVCLRHIPFLQGGVVQEPAGEPGHGTQGRGAEGGPVDIPRPTHSMHTPLQAYRGAMPPMRVLRCF